MSMHGDYIREHNGDGIVEREEGFATYRFIPLGEHRAVYIVDIYVRPDFRRTSVASEMADEIADFGRKDGCKYLVGSVVPSAKRSTDSVKVLLAYGMSLHGASDNLIIMKKEI
jgi:GNAT superfamily N-acetyltransferase